MQHHYWEENKLKKELISGYFFFGFVLYIVLGNITPDFSEELAYRQFAQWVFSLLKSIYPSLLLFLIGILTIQFILSLIISNNSDIFSVMQADEKKGLNYTIPMKREEIEGFKELEIQSDILRKKLQQFLLPTKIEMNSDYITELILVQSYSHLIQNTSGFLEKMNTAVEYLKIMENIADIMVSKVNFIRIKTLHDAETNFSHLLYDYLQDQYNLFINEMQILEFVLDAIKMDEDINYDLSSINDSLEKFMVITEKYLSRIIYFDRLKKIKSALLGLELGIYSFNVLKKKMHMNTEENFNTIINDLIDYHNMDPYIDSKNEIFNTQISTINIDGFGIVRICCNNTARLQEKYCQCGKAIDTQLTKYYQP